MTEHSTQTITAKITRLASQGDGVAEQSGKRYYVPFTAVGDEVEIEPSQPKARLLSITKASAERQKPACEYFTQCGGCNTQHLAPTCYREFKQQRLAEALKRAGFDENVLIPVKLIAPQSRRRVELKLQQVKKQLLLGFYRTSTHEVMDITHCPVAVPEISALIMPLKEQCLQLKKPSNLHAIQITQYDNGIELVLKVKSTPHQADKKRFEQWAEALSVQRVGLQVAENATDYTPVMKVVEHKPLSMCFGNANIEMPMGVFIQATAQGQQLLTEAALSIARKGKKIVDLYAGCGTYSFALAQAGAQVHGVEGIEAMVLAANNAIKQHQLEHIMRYSLRDLVKRPFLAHELAAYDAVVINPPRAGAKAQSQQIAQAKVPEVVMISCNPATLAKDLGYFKQAGYEVEEAAAVDQFVWSGHLESVVKLRRVI